MINDLQGAVLSLQQQLLGGALASVTVVAGAVSAVSMQTGGYYLVAPKVTITGDGTGAAGHAVLNGNRVDSVVVDNGGSGYTTANIAFSI